MKIFLTSLVLSLALAATPTSAVGGKGPRAAEPSSGVSQGTPTAEANEKWMVEGQKRFLTNCGRCHQSPHLFSPREMSMAVRHMRVRAMLTQQDMDYVLYYVTHQ